MDIASRLDTSLSFKIKDKKYINCKCLFCSTKITYSLHLTHTERVFHFILQHKIEMFGNYFRCFIALVVICISEVDATNDDTDILQQLVNRMAKLEDDNAKKDVLILKMKDDMALMEDGMAMMEDDIEDRVSKLEELAKIGTLREGLMLKKNYKS